ncbi:MAG: Trk system potassium transporter TrkA [Bacteroidia bacterium]
MKIVIAGAGEVGYHLAKLLTKESHSIVLIDTNSKILKRAETEMDLLAINGSAYSVTVLDKIGMDDTDLLISVTSSETVNLTVATLGKQLGAKRTVARVNNAEFVKLKDRLNFQNMGIDMIISPEELASKEIFRLLRRSAFTDAFDFEFGKLTLLGMYLQESSPLLGTKVEELEKGEGKLLYTAIAIHRNHSTIIPKNEDVFQLNDHVFFLCMPDGVDDVRNLFGSKRYEIKNVMIMGGGNVGFNAAKKLSRRKNVKIIESDNDRCFELADKLPDVLVINDDGHDVNLLEEENIEKMDAFIAVTGNSETNIMSCLVAKNHGVKKTIAMVENMDYINLSQNIGIDTLINKKVIAANNIFRYVRQAHVVNIAGIHGVDAEVLEVLAPEGSKVTRRTIGDLKFPEDSMIGGIIRDDKSWISRDDFQIEGGDKVVIFALPAAIKKTLEFFK